MKSTRLKNLTELILTQPTAPFRETWVTTAVSAYCATAKIPTWVDHFGNVWVNVTSQKDLSKKELIFVAHSDHPGIVIEGFKKRGKSLYAYGTWLGGGPLHVKKHPVLVFSEVDTQIVLKGEIHSHTLKGTRGPQAVEIKLEHSPFSNFSSANIESLMKLGPWGACLWFKKSAPQGLKFVGDMIHTKAADDLAGVCAILEGITSARKYSKNVAFLLSRAEESGFHGTLNALHTLTKQKVLQPSKQFIISVENSSRLYKATPGNGPIIRLGDRMSIFDATFSLWIEGIASRLTKSIPAFQHQRKLMDGGACEGTAFSLWNFRVGAISIPLENYHNQYLPTKDIGLTKLTDFKAHPEKIHWGDLQSAALLIEEIVKCFNVKTFLKQSEKLRVGVRKMLLAHHFSEAKKFDNRS